MTQRFGGEAEIIELVLLMSPDASAFTGKMIHPHKSYEIDGAVCGSAIRWQVRTSRSGLWQNLFLPSL